MFGKQGNHRKPSAIFWWILLAVGLLAIGTFFYGEERNRRWMVVKRQCGGCRSRMSSIGLALMLYGDDDSGDKMLLPDTLEPLLQSEELEFLDFDPPVEFRCCPATGEPYRYVAYGSLDWSLDLEHIPLLLDAPGNHRKFSSKWSEGTTFVTFANGRQNVVEDISCFMDIYHRFGRFLPEREREILREHCQTWDAESLKSR